MTTATEPAGQQLDDCPECGGRGEVLGLPIYDPSTGAWDENASMCTWCDGTGEALATRDEGFEEAKRRRDDLLALGRPDPWAEPPAHASAS